MVSEAVTQIRAAVERAVVGRRAEVDAVLAAFLAGGHVILEGAPGTAKTLMVRALALASGCSFRRIQFTPDLMPADVTGTNVYDPRITSFRLVHGPVFTEIALADEINRAPAKTQAALLECMEEGRVTIDGVTHSLPEVFTVFATMNPVEFEGTFPLPEAQLDRFLMKVRMSDIDAAAEREVIARYASGADPWALATGGMANSSSLSPEARFMKNSCESACQTPERSGLPSAVRGAGAERSGLPFGPLGIPAVG